jgi:hypothetical protein
MMSPPDHQMDSIHKLFARIHKILLTAWRETGYGQITIDSERINQNKIRVIIQGSTHYRYVISDEEIRRFCEVMGHRFPGE